MVLFLHLKFTLCERHLLNDRKMRLLKLQVKAGWTWECKHLEFDNIGPYVVNIGSVVQWMLVFSIIITVSVIWVKLNSLFLFCRWLGKWYVEGRASSALTTTTKCWHKVWQVGELSTLLSYDLTQFIIHHFHFLVWTQTGRLIPPTGFEFANLNFAAFSADFLQKKWWRRDTRMALIVWCISGAPEWSVQ